MGFRNYVFTHCCSILLGTAWHSLVITCYASTMRSLLLCRNVLLNSSIIIKSKHVVIQPTFLNSQQCVFCGKILCLNWKWTFAWTNERNVVVELNLRLAAQRHRYVLFRFKVVRKALYLLVWNEISENVKRCFILSLSCWTMRVGEPLRVGEPFLHTYRTFL